MLHQASARQGPLALASAAAGADGLRRPCWPPAAGYLPSGPVSSSSPSGRGTYRSSPLVIKPPLKPKLSYVGITCAGEGMSPDKSAFAGHLEGRPQPPSISRSDQDFADAYGIEFVESREGINFTELNDLFEKVGFPRRDPDKLQVALQNTYHCVWIRCAKKTRMARLGQLIGFARATSDGALSATIWDVAVNPGWQRVGLGRAMMERLTRHLVENGIPTVTLYAEPGVVALYEKLGYVKDPEGIRGMAFQRRRKKVPALSR